MAARPRLAAGMGLLAVLLAPLALHAQAPGSDAHVQALGSDAHVQAPGSDAHAQAPGSDPGWGTVAVLPFTNLSRQRADEWIGSGIAESVRADLERHASLPVVSRARMVLALAEREAETAPGAIRVGQAVGADVVVTGAFQRQGDRIRLTARMLAVSDGTVLRTAKLDGAMDELFGLQDRVVAELGLADGVMSPTRVGVVARAAEDPAPDRAEGPSAGAAASGAARSPFDVLTVLNRRPGGSRGPGLDARAGTPGGAPTSAGGTGDVLPTSRRGDATIVDGIELPFAFNGPPVPRLPAVVSRDDDGRATVRALRVTEPLNIDGRLTEAFYETVPGIGGFIQMEPMEGAPATELTEIWVAFDDDNVYIAFRCWESDLDRVVANEMRRDSTRIFQGNDNVAVMLDTFYDRRNALLFEVNPIGGRIDGQVTNERQFSLDWNPIWDVRTAWFDNGWTVEMAIPFKSIRYQPGRAQIWGINARRASRWKNEGSLLTRVPASAGQMGLFQGSRAATLVGIEAPLNAGNLEIKPYFIGDVSTDVTAGVSNDIGRDAGFDVRYGLNENLLANFTYNTDFAQVEADEQQVNLTRFSLFFPEKREFFLENQGLFSFGGAGGTSFGGGGGTPILFYSRRIGLHQGLEVPIGAGGRLTGRIGRYSLGLLNIQTDEAAALGLPGTNFSVVRLKGDILRRSSVGMMYTGRSASGLGPGRNDAFGFDGTFAFYDNVVMNTYWARTGTDGRTGDETSYRAQFDYSGDRYGFQLEHLYVGDDFNPEIGFVRRDDMRQTSGSVRFSPRPRNARVVRKYSYSLFADYVEDMAGRPETRELGGDVGIEFQNSDQLSAGFARIFEFLPREFPIARGITLPVDEYEYSSGSVQMTFGQQRRVSGRVGFAYGTFFNGHRTTFSVSQGRMNLGTQLNLEPTYSYNRVTLVQGAFTTHLLGARITAAMTPFMFASALVQYNSSADLVSSNVRLRWEYQPGSELFVVYNEQRNTDVFERRFPMLTNRALIVKVNRLFRF